ncbi:hypothetical protein DICSQDRAFT_135993 [Dichomitus squalens LYAD-421 SS1]|nr:uncharacterized protein DICSQDRAFT_135993 [Dichomitus squalens LYAD-421 SS1]EJF62400.1 hypothetical protein DICSQDRAFT_135993 [Dichomitus squalens LYAD-421 SS1]
MAPSSSRNSNGHGQSAVAIAFEVIAGVVGLVVVLALARFLYAYKRTPPLDRVSVYVNRHNLEREMEEMERDRMATFARALESFRWRPPPPPYQHAPAYETVVNPEGDGSIDWGRPTEPSLSQRPP